jgi:hypothetical protein
MWESTQHLRTRPLFRALGLLWSRIGPARIYVIAGAAALSVLAFVGLVHLLSSVSGNIPDRKTKASGSTNAKPDKEALMEITEIGSGETKGRNGQKNVTVKIGVAPRPNLRKKGEVEIRVAFFDLSESNEMRPTDAEVNYEWLTPVRDWTDPTPKYLVATYEGAGRSRKSLEKLRYGGFVVRVYFDGQLQAERSEPKELVAALRSKATPAAPLAALANEQARNPAVRVPATPSPPAHVNRESSSAVPYASPVPDKAGFVYSPHDPKFLIDVRGVPPGTEVNDPNTGKLLKVP